MDENLIPSKVNDAVRLCDNTSLPKFIGFLRPEEAAIASSVAEKLCCRYLFFGGYEDAERVFLGVFPDWCNDVEQLFPIIALTLNFREVDIITHRQILGTIMSLGVTRESVGDILIEKGRAVVFFTKEIAAYVKDQITKIGKVGVTVMQGFNLPLPGMQDFKFVTETIASTRLDCVIASLVKCSRKTAAEFIEGKLVLLNSFCTEKTTKTVVAGDKITVRGKGKFVIDSIDGPTKKDRLIINARKYI